VVQVQDNGPGIPPDILPRIFDSFFTTKPRGVGTGLGLPISQGIVRSLGGEITVDSRPSSGTIFRVRLPAAVRPTAHASVRVQSAAVASDRSVPALGYSRRRILAVDDEALLLKAYRRMLSDVHDVETAVGAQEALRVLSGDCEFDAILCDLQMPDISGAELYASVRLRYPGLAERFIFVTGGAFSTDAKRFLEESSCAVINKPFRVEELLTMIERKLEALGATDVSAAAEGESEAESAPISSASDDSDSPGADDDSPSGDDAGTSGHPLPVAVA
jgi:CheY-like chemotaxis protein